jgi:hypothetical protein
VGKRPHLPPAKAGKGSVRLKGFACGASNMHQQLIVGSRAVVPLNMAVTIHTRAEQALIVGSRA